MDRHSSRLDYADHLARESDRFAAVLRDASPGLAVPTCPDWDAADLLWHLGGVQLFWATIVQRELTESRQVEALGRPERPADWAGLLEFFTTSSTRLREALATAEPDDAPRWTWAPDQTVGFTRRRQAHEALIHRLDAEATTGQRTGIDARLAADGVDEVLEVMYGGSPGWGTFDPDTEAVVGLHATDTGDRWLATLGRFTGVDPDGGTAVDEDDFRTTRGAGETSATLSAPAADLDCWLWHRPADRPVERGGDRTLLQRFESIVAQEIK